jgi:hypothetical protein
MTPDEAAALVIIRWRLGHHPKYIMVALVMLGFNVTTAQVMQSIRIYCDKFTENKAPHPGVIPDL